MKINNLSIRLSLRVIVSILIFQTLIWILYARRESNILDNYTGEIIRTTESILTSPITKDNPEDVLDYLESQPFIYSIQVFDRQGNMIVNRYKNSLKVPDSDLIKKEVVLQTTRGGFNKIILSFSKSKISKLAGRQNIINIFLNILLLCILFIVIYIFFRNDIDFKFANLMEIMEKVSMGNFRVRVKADDTTEFGLTQKRLKLLIDNLVDIITKLRGLTKNVSTAINQLRVNSKDIISKMEVQQTICETFTKTLSEVSEKQKSITKNTEKLIGLSNNNLEGVTEVKHTSEETFRTIDELNRELTDTLSSVTELSQAAKEISSLSDKSNNEIVEVSSSVDEIIRTTKEIESLAGSSLQMSEETTRVIIEKGIFSTADAVEEMEKIEDSVKDLMETIHSFEEQSKDIEKILAVIKDITEQTGLLSLNAQILAVQAGEYGKSFSVVADEMKVLSEKTYSSTREISKIISSLKTEMKEVVSETKKVVFMIGIGHEKVARIAEFLNEIHATSKKSTDMSSNIVRATKGQTRGIESITVAIERIKQMTSEIKKATSEQEKGVSYILNSIEKIKDIADIVTKTTKEQVESNKYIIQNIELTNKIISEIASASKDQQDVNNNLVVALNQLKNSNMDIHRDLREQTLLLSSLYEEVELLRKKLNIFQTDGKNR